MTEQWSDQSRAVPPPAVLAALTPGDVPLGMEHTLGMEHHPGLFKVPIKQALQTACLR